MYGPNNRDIKYVMQELTELKEQTDIGTIAIGHFNTPFPVAESLNRWKI